MNLSNNIWRLILSFIDEPEDIYNLLLVNKWFNTELQSKFNSYFVAHYYTGYRPNPVIYPRIYKSLYQSTIDYLRIRGRDFIIEDSVSYMLMEDIYFDDPNQDLAINIKHRTVYPLWKHSISTYLQSLPIDLIHELDKYFKYPITLCIEGNNKTIFCKAKTLIDSNRENIAVVIQNINLGKTNIGGIKCDGGSLYLTDIGFT